jgi:uncharacterized protein (TIGR04141 family)
MEDEVAEIAQISFFLAKEEITLRNIFDSNKNILVQPEAQERRFDIGGARCHFFCFETISTRSNPPWLDFVNDKLSGDDAIHFKTRSRNTNGLLLVTVEHRIFAATFGRSASSYLDKDALEPDFGIKTAMNMCGNEEIRQTRSQSHAITPTQIDRQVGKPSDTFVFGLSEAEDLRYISAHMKDAKNITLQGRDNLTVKIIGKDKLNWDGLVGRCREFLEAYRRKDYEALFPNYKNFRRASEDECADSMKP